MKAIEYSYTASVQKSLKIFIPEDHLEDAIKEAMEDEVIDERSEFFDPYVFSEYIDIHDYDMKTEDEYEDDIEVVSIEEAE